MTSHEGSEPAGLDGIRDVVRERYGTVAKHVAEASTRETRMDLALKPSSRACGRSDDCCK